MSRLRGAPCRLSRLHHAGDETVYAGPFFEKETSDSRDVAFLPIAVLPLLLLIATTSVILENFHRIDENCLRG